MKGTVIAFGTFDILHPGHLKYLSEARKLGNKLVVIIARDESVLFFKKRAPVMVQKDRAILVGSLKMVDKAVIGKKISKSSDIYNIFLQNKPDVIALGYDQRVNIEELKRWLAEHKINARIVRIRARLNETWYKSSQIKKRMSGSI